MVKWCLYIVCCICLACSGEEVVAQQLTARQIMDRAAQAFRQAGGIRADFTYQLGSESPVLSGHIDLKDTYFVLQAAGMTTWFDGHTQWTYVAANEEVNISEPTADELQGLNPYAWLSLYRQGGQLALQSATAQSYQVRITPVVPQSQVHHLSVILDKQTFYPQAVILYYGLGEGDYTDIRLRNLHTHQSFGPDYFRFDARCYPKAEIIDLR